MSYQKLSLPPRVHDRILKSLSPHDYVKYVFLYNKYKGMLGRARGLARDQQLRVGFALDWFRQINFLLVNYPRWLSLGYITDTYPVGEWPDKDYSTVKAFEYAYHRQVGNTLPQAFSETYVRMSGKSYLCCFCGRKMPSNEPVLCKGLPSCCGCSGELVRPVKLFLYSEESSSYQERYRRLVGRVAEIQAELRQAELVHVFLGKSKKSFRCESIIKRVEDEGTTMVVMERLK